MKLNITLVLIALTLASGLGCGSRESTSIPPAGNEPSNPLPPGFNERLQAALAINNLDTRDTALGTVAVAAAGGGEAAIVKTAIGRMSSLDRRDDTAAVCAPKLTMKGKREDANIVAKMINSLDKRDRTFAELSKK